MERYPVRVQAHRDESLSRGLWLVKWLLLIPHVIALAVLWTGVVVLTLVAYVAILFTGRCPAAIRAYTIGVLRWTWRVGYYGYQALGTDQYPPFTLADVPGHPARFSVGEPEPIPRWLPLVAWLSAVPHLILIGALTTTATWAGPGYTRTSISVLGAAVLIAGLALLFTGRLPTGLHDLLVGIARWQLRVIAYLTMLTPRYPPFRLDQGGAEPPDGPIGPVHTDPSVPSVPADPSVPAHRPSAAGPVTALVIGVLILLPAVGLTIGGGTVLALDAARDSAGYVTSPAVALHSNTAAITAENLTITSADVWTRDVADVGGLRLTATAPAGRPVFIGIASQQAVDAWLGGTAHDQFLGMRSGTARYDRAGGTTRSVASPASEQFWLASAGGTGSTTVNWKVTDGQYAVVVANPDGSPGVTADVRGAVQLPAMSGLGTGLLVAGIVSGLLAVGLIVLGGVGLGRRHSAEPPGPGPQPPPQPAPPLSTAST
ncbi:DUF4389 domain-containing protein [Actinoplanes sp. NPDC020271]|uniref:DUF4389 domain-containing protein n=1 Tax=Actinoplanes sp. NPDC020271 TaxID=3363896 RepID=UPI0037A91CEF